MDIGIEKVDMYEGITVKVLLDSGVMGMFMDQKIVAKYGFKLQKLERPIMVRNVDGTNNSAGAITHQVEANMYYKGHIERMRMDVCNLGKTDVILGMPWLQAHNPEINWKTGEVKMTRCLPLCGRNTRLKEKRVRKKVKRVVTLEEEKIVRIIRKTREGKKKSRWTIGKLKKWYHRNSLGGGRYLGKWSWRGYQQEKSGIMP